MTNSKPSPLIIGAGPAGMRAAHVLCQAGLTPTVVDEGHRVGGQIYRQPALGAVDLKAIYGFEAKKAHELHSLVQTLNGRWNYLPNTLVWGIEAGIADTESQGVLDSIPYTQVILATGACERVIPIPGWTLPGVYTLGGAQIAYKTQRCSIGRSVVFAGTGPLLYLVAYQYIKAGFQVQALLDTSQASVQVQSAWGMLRHTPSLLFKGLYYLTQLRLHGVPMYHGVTLTRIDGLTRVESIGWEMDGQRHSIDCDAVGMSFGLKPETQLASLLQCDFEFDPFERQYFPRQDPSGRTSVDGVYVAGDGAYPGGADMAELAGRRAAYALLVDVGFKQYQPELQALSRQWQRFKDARRPLQQGFPFPSHQLGQLTDDTLICRCEEVSVGDIRATLADYPVKDVNRLKALCRVGMGRCQGRMCGLVATELLASLQAIPLVEVGRLRSQAPIKPLIMTGVASDE